jgi:hypothetical protein
MLLADGLTKLVSLGGIALGLIVYWLRRNK